MSSKKSKKAAPSEDAEDEKETKKPAAEGEEGEGEGEPKKGKKKLLFIVVGVVVLLAIGAGVFFSGMLGESGPHKDTPEEAKAKEDAAALAAKPVYYELPQFLVNLNSTTSRVSFLKMSVTLQLRDAEAVKVMDDNKPRIQDTFNTYLRELRPADIQGSAGIYRLRTELITRLNGTIGEGLVKDILFGEIIVQ